VTGQLHELLRPGRGGSARSLDVALLLGAGLGIHLLCVGAVALAPEGSLVASWWPAAGLGTGLAVVVGPARRRLVLLAVLAGSITGNLEGGRAPDIAVLFAVYNVVEVAVTTRLLCRRGGTARLREMADVTRLAVAVVVGASVLGVLTSVTVALLLDGPLVGTFVAVAPSHTAAQLLIVPAILALRTRTRHRRLGETAAQAGLLVVVTQLVFGVAQLPLAFVPLTVLVWGAVRLGLRTVTVELLLLVVAVTLLSSTGAARSPPAPRCPAICPPSCCSCSRSATSSSGSRWPWPSPRPRRRPHM
jgi:integral membrane sensor domain MASE1